MNLMNTNGTDFEIPNLLIIEDELSMRELLGYIFLSEKYSITMAASGQQAQDILQRQAFDVILQDVMLPDIDGINLLKQIKQQYPKTMVIVMTALSGWKTAVEAMRLGAFDYIRKPFDNKNIRMIVARAYYYKTVLESHGQFFSNFQTMIGNSLQMQKVQEMIRRVAPADATVIIYGESGTGKELVARTVHLNSARRENVFIPVNCGAIAESLIESELFGHVKGAFTGAVSNKKGLFEIAHEGTLFLDEIGEMSLQTQVKLLRVLEEKQFVPVGGNIPRHVDVRFVTATNRNLEEQVKKGEFREDLYYRLNVINIFLAPLRERRDDIPLLAGHFLSQHTSRFHKQVVGFTDETMQLFLSYDWPGNIRELGNLIQRAVLMCEGNLIEAKDLGGYIAHTHIAEPVSGYPALPPDGMDLENKIVEFETFYIQKALEQTGGRLTQAAKLLNLSFRGLRYKVKKYRIVASLKE